MLEGKDVDLLRTFNAVYIIARVIQIAEGVRLSLS